MVSFKNNARTTLGSAGSEVPQTALPMENVVGSIASSSLVASSTVDNILGTSSSLLNKMGNLPFIAMPIAFIGGGISNLGQKLGLSVVRKTGSALQAPNHYLEQTTVSDVVPRVLRKPIGQVSQSISNRLADGASWLSNATGHGDRRRAKYIGKSTVLFENAQKVANGLDVSKAPAHLQDRFHEIKGLITKAKHPGEIDAARLQTLMEEVQYSLKVSPEVQTQAGQFFNGYNGLVKATEKTLDHHQMAQLKPGENIRNMPTSLGKQSLGHVMMNGSFIALSGLSMFGDARTFKQNIAIMKEMYADMTGVKLQNVSTAKMLFGSLPGPLAEARSHLFKSTVAREAADAVNLAINVKQAVDHRFSMGKAMAGFGAATAVDQGTQLIMGPSILPEYQKFKQVYASAVHANQPLPEEFYSAFVMTFSKDLKKRGEAGLPFAAELAKQYAAEKATPGQILNEIESGKLMQRVSAVITATEAAKATAPRTHVERLNGANKEMPAIGKHTEMVNRTSTESETRGLS